MRIARLRRFDSTDQGTFSVLTSDGFKCYMTELPWQDNRRQISCIPPGIYEVKWHKSPRFGCVYKVFNVKDRSEILIHAGNYAGDVTKGYKTNSYGCLLPCKRLGHIGKQKAGLISRPAVAAITSYFEKQPFLLEIIDDCNNLSSPE